MKTKKENLKAYTLVELLLSVALVGMLMGFAVVVYQTFQFRNEVTSSVDTASRAMFTAQINSQVSSGDSRWGVQIANGLVTVFKGDSYATRDQTEDILYYTSTRVGVSGVTEIVFEKLTGETSNIGNVNFSTDNITKGISINAKGTQNYY